MIVGFNFFYTPFLKLLKDSETFETIDVDMIEEELEGTLQQGNDIEYWNVMGRTKIMRKKSS